MASSRLALLLRNRPLSRDYLTAPHTTPCTILTNTTYCMQRCPFFPLNNPTNERAFDNKGAPPRKIDFYFSMAISGMVDEEERGKWGGAMTKMRTGCLYRTSYTYTRGGMGWEYFLLLVISLLRSPRVRRWGIIRLRYVLYSKYENFFLLRTS
jgi:hypothetical protein